MAKIIALLTDFGEKDGYVAAMKGVIKSIATNADIVDITHNIEPQNVDEAAYILWSACRYFPKGTIFVSVVDPGVGSDRKIILMKTREYIFLAPDNGLLKYVMSHFSGFKTYCIENKEYFLQNLSNTFHGRDIFSPVAAYIYKGVPINKFGTESKFITKPEEFLKLEGKSKIVNAKLVYIDRFGNLITNVYVEKSGLLNDIAYIQIGKNRIKKFYHYYSQAHYSELFGLIGSNNLIEISLRNDSAARILKSKIGDKLKIFLK